jgi:hypothetical protein
VKKARPANLYIFGFDEKFTSRNLSVLIQPAIKIVYTSARKQKRGGYALSD